METWVLLKKTIHWFSFMPPCAIDIKPYHIAAKTPVKMPQSFHKAFPVSSFRADDPVAAQERSHPTREIKPLLMLAARGDAKRMSSLGPSPSQSRMEGESRLILKDHRFPRPQILKFFLTPGEIASRLPPGLEDRHNWLFLADNPVGASKPGLASLSVSGHSGALSVQRGSVRPSETGLGQNLEGIALNAVPPPGQSAASAGTGVPGSVCSSGLLIRRHLLPGSIDSGSCASALRPGTSSRAVAPRRSKEGRQSSTPSKPRACPWHKPPGSPGSPPDDGYRQVPYLQFNTTQAHA